MGVPAFFKWLMMRYPKVVIDAMQKIDSGYDINEFLRSKYDDESSMPEIDNLYLDMNGIIHPCCHPQDRPQPETEEEMFNAVFEYVDKLVGIIRPKKFMYLAVDGVAPRAKMNQQRSRRFRAAIEAQKSNEIEKNILKEWKRLGLTHPKENKKSFDSNTITPGTPFMAKLTDALKIYITHRLQNHPMWRGLTVVFSDSSVPGEGEHKILEYIRKQRTQTHYDPNTKHCIYGADADLIMLALITHEPHFYILRESLNENQWKKCDLCGMTGHVKEECKKLNPDAAQNIKSIADIEFSLLKVNVVREYLELEFRPLQIKFEFDLERFIDDFIFLCFFVGNDFIPNLPSLKIREGAIDALLFIYKNEIVNLDYYITEGNGKINLSRAEKILEKLGAVEESFLRSYTNNKIYYENRNRELAKSGAIVQNTRDKKDILYEKFKQLKSKNVENNTKNQEEEKEEKTGRKKNISATEEAAKVNSSKTKNKATSMNKDEINLDLDEAERETPEKFVHPETQNQDELKNLITLEHIQEKLDFDEDEIQHLNKLREKPEENFKRVFKEYLKESETEKVSKYVDTVRLGEAGYKDRYYQDKFKTSYANSEFRNLVKRAYIEGICWVFHYYYNGCVSWGWYYPFHYAPFASDLTHIGDLQIDFDMGEPYEPVEQLLSVLPPYSSYALPACLRNLMHNKESEIVDFFPKDIMLDINGHPFSWMGVNLIPFVDEDRIRTVVARLKPRFSAEELERNKFGNPLVFFNHKENESLKNLVGENYKKENFVVDINTPNFRVFSGTLSFFDDLINKEKHYTSKLEGLSIKVVKDSRIGAMEFQNAESKPHFSRLLQGVVIPQKIVLEDNLDFYNKRGFRGEQTIKLVNSILRYKNEIESEFKNSLFDRSHFNNNRAIEYNPAELEMIRKKRYREREAILNGSGGYNANQQQNKYNHNTNQDNQNFNRQNFNYNYGNNPQQQFKGRNFNRNDEGNPSYNANATVNNRYLNSKTNYNNMNQSRSGNQYIDLTGNTDFNRNLNFNPNNYVNFNNNNMNAYNARNDNYYQMQGMINNPPQYMNINPNANPNLNFYPPPTNIGYGNQFSMNQNPNLNVMHQSNQYTDNTGNINANYQNPNPSIDKSQDLVSQFKMYKGKNQ